VHALLAGIAAGTEPYTVLHSALPAAQAGPIAEVNAVTLEDAVLGETRAVLLLLTSQSCPYCRQLWPVLTAAAARLDPAVARAIWMDGPANDLPDVVPLRGYYPVVFLWPAGEKSGEPVEFLSANRTVESLLSFVRENAAAR
jgi:thiol-disulfide isomerase/thioredoxin